MLTIQPLPLPVTDVVIVNEAVAFAESEASSQRTMRVAVAYVQPGAEAYNRRDGSVSVRTTFCAEPGPRLRARSVQTAVEPLRVPFFVSARSVL